MELPFSVISKSEEDTIAIANDFADLIENGMIIILNGELGTGKTFFIKQVLKKFKVMSANSPTFAIVNEYKGDKVFYHLDFYRINKETELLDIGIKDYFYEEESVIFIEWGNLFPKILPRKRIEIDISYNDKDLRIFHFIKYE
jgi:tRNA threonylcarbamoyladenosine biosynthesis protein TsaE